LLAVDAHDLDGVVLRVQRDRLDAVGRVARRRVQLLQERREAGLLRPVAVRDQLRGEERQDDHDDDRERGALEETGHGRTRGTGAWLKLLDKCVKATSGREKARKLTSVVALP